MEAMSLQDISDEDLVKRFKAGDVVALDAIVQRYQDRVFRLASVWLFDPQLAADAAQEVFLRSYKGLGGFRFGSTTYTWIYRVTKNVCHEFNRKRRIESLDTEPVDPGKAPEGEVVQADALRRVRELVARLPERQRDVFLLRVFEEFSVRETAQALNCREGTVKTLLHRASRKLKLDMESMGVNL